MQIEIDEELVDGIEEVLERRGEMKDLSMKQRLDKVAVEIKQILEETLSGEPKEKVEEHNCTENIDYGKPDWRFIRFVSSFSNTKDDTVHFYGKCSVCGKKLKKVFKYVETRDRDTDEIIDSAKETEKEKAASLGKFTSHEISIGHADKWRQMTASDIISSIWIGLSVLDGKEFSKEYHRLLVLMEEIAKMLAREV